MRRFLIALLSLLAAKLQVGVRPVGEPVTGSKDACGNGAAVGVFVLNLDRRPDRLQSLSTIVAQQWPWACHRVCRVSAPDGKAWRLDNYKESAVISTSVLTKLHASEAGKPEPGASEKPLTKGGIGCILGHALIWERIVQEKLPYAIVMEDDVTALHPQLKDFVCNLPVTPNWETLSFSAPSAGRFSPQQSFEVKEGHDYTTAMYAITLDGARKALRNMFPLQHPYQLDDPRSSFRQLRGFVTVPRIMTQRGSRTDTDVQSILLEIGKSNQSDRCDITDCAALRSEDMIVPGVLNFTTQDVS